MGSVASHCALAGAVCKILCFSVRILHHDRRTLNILLFDLEVFSAVISLLLRAPDPKTRIQCSVRRTKWLGKVDTTCSCRG